MNSVDSLGIRSYDMADGLITFGSFPGGSVPTTADKFAAGCILMGNGKVYSNQGTSASPSFQDINTITGAEIADGAVTTAKIEDSAVTTDKIDDDAVTNAKIGDLAVDTEQLAADAVENSKLADNAVSIENIDAGAKPIMILVGGGIFTTAGGDANESITVTGCLGTDTAVVWVQKEGATPRTVDTITPGTDAVAVVMSGDPSTDHKLGYFVFRAAA